MCGRYAVSEEEPNARVRAVMAEVLERMAGNTALAEWRPGEIRPTDLAPVVITNNGGQEARLLRWGFPSPKGSGVIINARRETLREKPMFRNLVDKRRCMVPADGFFEWGFEEGATKKTKYMIEPTGQPLLMAGLFNVFTATDGRRYAAYTIVTVAAQGGVADIHDRMPLMLDESSMEAWLDLNTPSDEVDALPTLTEMSIRKVS